MTDNSELEYPFAHGRGKLVLAPDKFRGFRGFKPEGVFLGASRDSPVEVALRLLKQLRGEPVEVCFSATTLLNDYDRRYDPSETFRKHEDRFTVDSRINNGYLRDVQTDTIDIYCVRDGRNYTVQRIVIGDSEITEIDTNSPVSCVDPNGPNVPICTV